ncbi:MAG: histidine phosphatase family protein [Marinifilaceae bacterium]
MIKLILTRHGETLENRVHMMQGHIPGTLSELGIQQAHDLAALLSDEAIDHIISSDLARSFDTAKVVADKKGMQVQPTILLREIDWGPHTGGRLDKLDWYNLPEGCETLEQLYGRANDFIEFIKANYSDCTILAVGHGAIDRAITALLTGKEAKDMPDMPIIKNTFCLYFEL